MKNLLVLLLLGGGLTAWFFYQEHGQKRAELADLQKNVTANEASVAGRRAELDAIVKALDLRKKVEARQAEIQAIDAKRTQLQEKIARASAQRAKIVTDMRQTVVGALIPELTLTDGRKLTQVRVTKADDSGLSVTLPSGVQKLKPEELPDDLRQQLHYR